MCLSIASLRRAELVLTSRSPVFVLAVIVMAGTRLGLLLAQDDQHGAVAAVVDGHAITVARVDRYLTKTTGSPQIPDAWRDHVRGEALEHLVRRHAVLTGLRKSGRRVSDAEIRLEFSRLEDRLREVDENLGDYLIEMGTTRDELAYEFEWKIAWRRYLDHHLTDQRLEDYYRRHRRRFDGTQMKIAHLLLRSGEGPASREITARARKIREDVSTGRINWADAVTRFSEAESSASNQGVAGWISYDGPMPEAVCHAAFDLEPEQISEPVTTIYGVHLIKCLEIRPGKVGPRDARQKVRADAMRYLFNQLADQQRDTLVVNYVVDWPPARQFQD